jgi:uncharacterized membrane protein
MAVAKAKSMQFKQVRHYMQGCLLCFFARWHIQSASAKHMTFEVLCVALLMKLCDLSTPWSSLGLEPLSSHSPNNLCCVFGFAGTWQSN